MPTEPDDPHYPQLEEEAGGPVKSFLEHLEDLRWMLIKAVSALLLAMIVCLVAGNKLVAFLTYPLRKAQIHNASTNEPVRILLGTNVLGSMDPIELGLTNNGATNHIWAYHLVPIEVGTNRILALSPEYKEIKDPDEALVTLKNYGPIGAFKVAFQLAFYGGMVIAGPFVLFFIGQFVLPALHVHEKKFLYQTVGFGSVLFILGVVFCYFVIMQVALLATVQFSQWMGFGADEWRAEDYIGFVCKFMLGMGLSFQIPVVILTMVKIGLMDYKKLVAFRSYWIVINLVLSAVVTPSGDPFTMLLMAAPLQVLYELSVLIARAWYRRDEAAAKAAAQE
ncbi:MAG TPA: twin-arginine translocase subunit TatC [Methylomirabilota bacterium]|nr:twin-arginine translocase subunit TatC [Methylomirabilota bacterium]